MFRDPRSLFLPFLVVIFVLSACQGDPRGGRIAANEVAINIEGDPRSLDPSKATDIPSARAILCLTRGLTVLDDAGEPQPELAESWRISPDGLVYDFKLREAKWSNGDPVTADDFVFAWTERMLNPEFAAEYAYMLFRNIKGAKDYYDQPGLGPGTVQVFAFSPEHLQVHLNAPTPFFLKLTAHHSYFPVNRRVAEENPDWALKPETYVGNGPFVMKEYIDGNMLVAEKNPRYWNAAAVGMERVVLRMFEKETTALIAYESGEIDANPAVPRAEITRLRGGRELHFSHYHGTYYLDFNCEKEPLDNPLVRRALALAIDRRTIVEKITRADEQPAFMISPPALYDSPPAPPFADADYEQARALLTEAGYPGGKDLPTLEYLYNTQETHREIAQAIQETWKKELGVEVRIENQEFRVVLDNRREGKFMIGRAGWIADYDDPLNFLEVFDSQSENNTSNFFDEKFDAILAAIRAQADPVAREALMRDADLYLMQQMPIAPIYNYTNPYLVTPRLRGYVINPMGLFDPAKLIWGE